MSAQGNLAEFVKQRPEAKAYYELASADLKFVLPEPGFLEGIKSKDKPILKMTHVSFKCAAPRVHLCSLRYVSLHAWTCSACARHLALLRNAHEACFCQNMLNYVKLVSA